MQPATYLGLCKKRLQNQVISNPLKSDLLLCLFDDDDHESTKWLESINRGNNNNTYEVFHSMECDPEAPAWFPAA